MLTGQNGILNRAAEAKEKTDVAQKDENEKLQGYEDIINQYVGNLPSGEETKPYLPNSTFSYKEGDFNSGLVIEDADGNEYVWVEVPTTIYKNSKYNTNGEPSSSTDFDKIEKCLKAYTSDYSDSSYSDTNTEFKTLYQNMLKSLYENGGFWIGRYEAGIDGDTPRVAHTEITNKAVVRPNKIPYNYVTRGEAQSLAKEMNYESCTSSLVFGIQWDLILKYIENKNATKKENLTVDSTKIGNYYSSEFVLNRGKFAQYGALLDWFDYSSEERTDLVTKSQKKTQNIKVNAILLTTGATETTNLQNIYDIAGNVREWTLEFNSTSNLCVFRGGSYYDDGSGNSAKNRISKDTSDSGSSLGFRIGLWK